MLLYFFLNGEINQFPLFYDFQRLQRKTPSSAPSLSPSSSQSLSVEEEHSLSSQPAAAEELPDEPSFPPTNTPLILQQTPITVHPVPVSVASSAHPAQEKTALPAQVCLTLSQGDTQLTEASASLTAVSTPQLAQTATSPSPLLNPVVSSVLPVQEALMQTPQPQVNSLHNDFFSIPKCMFVIIMSCVGFLSPQSPPSNHNSLQGLNGQPTMAAPVFTKVVSYYLKDIQCCCLFYFVY